MSDQILDNNSGGSGERPTFLTVLCILTWVGSGLGIVGNFVGANVDYIPMWYKLVIVACNAATAYGAYEMWNMKKSGLMIYTIGEVAAVIFPFVLLYAIFPPSIAELAGSFMMIGALFPIAFLVMYWANAKHLK